MKNTQKGSAVVVLLVIVVVILLVVVGYMYFKQPTSVNQISDNSQSVNTQNTTSIPNTTNPVTANNAVSLNQLENTTYQVGDLVTMHGTEGVTLVNGKASNPTDGMSADLSSRDIIYGDLNSDGINDAVVFLYTSKGGAKNGNSQYELEMVLGNGSSVKTFRCSSIRTDFDVSQYSIKNGLVIDNNQNDIYPVGNLREVYKFDGTKCVSGDIDITTGKANF